MKRQESALNATRMLFAVVAFGGLTSPQSNLSVPQSDREHKALNLNK